MENGCMTLGNHTRILHDFVGIIQRSYMISYKDRTKKSWMDIMKSYIILVWIQRNFYPGYKKTNKPGKLWMVLKREVYV